MLLFKWKNTLDSSFGSEDHLGLYLPGFSGDISVMLQFSVSSSPETDREKCVLNNYDTEGLTRETSEKISENFHEYVIPLRGGLRIKILGSCSHKGPRQRVPLTSVWTELQLFVCISLPLSVLWFLHEPFIYLDHLVTAWLPRPESHRIPISFFPSHFFVPVVADCLYISMWAHC